MKKVQILIVEDEIIVAMSIQNKLQRLGYTVTAMASTGREVLHKIAEIRPDLVLMDIHLKGDMDGVKTAEQIRSHFNIPVIYLTAYSDEDTLQRAKVTEPFGYILKPFGEKELYITIEIALYKSRIEKALQKAYKELEKRVKERTVELSKANEFLRAQITERKKAMETLRRREQELSALVENTPDIISRFDRHLRHVYVNQAIERAIGIPPQAFIGKTNRELGMPEELVSYWEENLREVFETGQEKTIEFEFLTPHGFRYYQSRLVPEFAGDGSIEFILVVARDITEHQQAGEKLRRQNEYLIALHETTLGLMNRLEPDDLLEAIIKRAAGLVKTPHGFVYLVEPKETELKLRVGTGIYRVHLGYRLKFGEGLAGKVWKTGKPLVISDYSNWSGRVPDPSFNSNRAAIGIPLKSSSQVVGVIGLVYLEEDRKFGDEEVAVLSQFAELASIALDNARLYNSAQQELAERKQMEEALRKAHNELERRVEERTEELSKINAMLREQIAEREQVEKKLRQQNEYLTALHETALGLMKRLELSSLLEVIIMRAGALVGTRHGYIYLVEPGKTELILKVGTGLYSQFLGYRVKPGEGLVGKVWQTGQPLVIGNYCTWPGRLSDSRLDIFRAVLGIPLKSGSKNVGVLGLSYVEEGRTFRDEETTLLTRFAELISIALDNARLFEQVRSGRERLQALSHQLMEVQEVERRHIARELHDEIGQILTGLKLILEMSTGLSAEAIKANLNKAQGLINELLVQVRELSLSLRPTILDDLGLLPALLWYFEHYTARTQVSVIFKHTGVEGQRFIPEIETATYRIVQEALTNVARHAGVTEVRVQMWVNPDLLFLQIEDQGNGFDPEATLTIVDSSGLTGMRERTLLLGGQFRVESTPGIGTRLTVELPLGEKIERRERNRYANHPTGR